LWKLIHLLTYIILPAVYIHSDDIGTFFQDQTLKLYIQFITILFVLLCLYKLGKYLGILKYEYSVKNIEQITRDTFKITFKPLSSFIRPKRGQFIEIQSPRFGETHPFTVLSFDEQSGELALGIKSSGKFSTQLSQLKIGNKVYLDGPYGIFTKEAYLASTKKIVLIAGGIGVTPFINFMDYFKDHTQNYDEVAFFFGNKTVEDILFKNEIESIQSPNFIAVNVLSLDKTNHKYENGFINSALIKKYIGDLCDYKFFICGPPIMMQLVKADLIKNSVKTVDIHTEEFSW
jgi:predicted ferric reductase